MAKLLLEDGTVGTGAVKSIQNWAEYIGHKVTVWFHDENGNHAYKTEVLVEVLED